jgi:hypothetical protein
VDLDDRAAHAASLRIPGHRVAHLEFLRHATALQSLLPTPIAAIGSAPANWRQDTSSE